MEDSYFSMLSGYRFANRKPHFSRHQNTPLSGVRPPLDDLASTIAQSVGGYVASACLNELNWVVTRAENIDVRSLQNAGNLKCKLQA